MLRIVAILTRLLGPFLALGIANAVLADQAPRILVMGDSLMASHLNDDKSIGHVVAASLGARATINPVAGARVIYKLPLTGAVGFNISKQYRQGQWDWIVVNGGGNDLWLGCGCNRCERKMSKLISQDGARGAIPEMIADLRRSGARVVYVGYLRSPGMGSPIEHCRDEGDQLEARIAKMAQRDPGFFFVSNADLVPSGDRSFHMFDMIHPSEKASRAIGMRVADLIQRQTP